MQPLLDKVLVSPKKEEQEMINGVLHLENSVIAEGTVVKAGPGKTGEPMSLIPGDQVIWRKGTGVNYLDYVILDQREIWMVI